MTLVATSERIITVGLGEICVTNDVLTSLACFGLGSCIGLAAYDPVSKVAGLAHIVLPESDHSSREHASAKYADIAVPLLFNKMCKRGAVKSRLIVKLVGGAQMLRVAGFSAALDMGARNLEMTSKTLASEGIRVSSADTGGNQGRSVWLSVDSGKVMVRIAGTDFKEI